MSEKSENPTGTTASPLRRWLIAALPLTIFLALTAIFLKQLESGGSPRDIPSVLIGRPAPEFDLPALAGLERDGVPVPGISRASLNGKVSIVNVWASWCVPCRVEHPMIEALAKDGRLQVLGINYKDKTANALRFLSQLGNPFSAIGIDANGSAAIDWGVYGVPETFITDANGVVRYKHIGPLTEQSYKEKFLPELEKVAGDR